MPGFPAARLGDFHQCPMVTPGVPPIPHVGGPVIVPCVINVLTGKQPQAVVSSMLTCVGPPDAFTKGSMGVMAGKQPCTRQTVDITAHGGFVVVGCPTVLIGETGAGGGGGGSGGPVAGGAGQSATTDPIGHATAYIAPWKQAFVYKNAVKTAAPFCERCNA